MSAAIASKRVGAIEIDTSQYPLVVQRWHSDPTANELDQYFVYADQLADHAIATQSYYAVVVTGSLNLSATGRKYLGAWIDKVPKARRERALGSYVVISSAAIRGMLTAMRWLSHNLDDVYPVASEAEALQLAHKRIAGGK